MTVRGWKSGRNCASVVITFADRLGATRTATLRQVSGPDPSTSTLASGDTPTRPAALVAGTPTSAASTVRIAAACLTTEP